MTASAGRSSNLQQNQRAKATLRDARGPFSTPPGGSRAVQALVAYIRRHLSGEQQRLLGWEERRVPHRQIAEWLGLRYEATTKRIWRLKRRLQALTVAYHAVASTDEERRELERLFRRAGVSLAGAAAVTRIAPRDDLKETEP